jgi:hypothetical protein
MRYSNSSSFAARLLVIAVLAATMFSFRNYPGGDHFAIYLNDKMLLEHFVHRDKSVKTVQLSESSINDALVVQYSHCGVVGNARNISLVDGSKNVLKSWTFKDLGEGSGKNMELKVKDIIAVQKTNSGKKINLFYSSKQMPEGMVLASIVINNDAKASLK